MALDISKFIPRFIGEARDHLVRLNQGLAALERDPGDQDNINSIFRSAHTIKGSAKMLNFTSIADTAHQLEDVLSALREGSLHYGPKLGDVLYRGLDGITAQIEYLDANGVAPDNHPTLNHLLEQAAQGKFDDPEPSSPADTATPDSLDTQLKTPDSVRVRLTKLDELIKLMGELVSSHARLQQRLTDIKTITRQTPDATLKNNLHPFSLALRDDVQAQELLMEELHSKTLIMRLLPLAIVFEPAGHLLRGMARTIGKKVECSVSGGEIELDRHLIDALSDPLTHLLRNAIDHGIESPEQRRAAGKPEQGRITLAAYQDGGWVSIEISDDGNGIPLDAIREKALRKGIYTPEQIAAFSEQEVIELIFLPGFSTSAIITDLSGRGVGLDVVKSNVVDNLKGMVAVDSQPGVGTRFSLRLPLSLAVMRVLLVGVQGLAFGFTAQYVSELLRVSPQELFNIADRQAVSVRNEFVPIVTLAELLHIPAAQIKPPSSAGNHTHLLLLVVQVRQEKLALVVDDLLDEQDMVIKSLPLHMRKLTMVSGIVTTGKNELVNILHVPVLFDMAHRLRNTSIQAQTPATPTKIRNKLRILVVDDSLNTREIEKDVLEAHGYQVTLAEDGLDGLRKARSGDFDAILTDVEMPNLDGFSLTAKLRQENKYHDTPIIIITSREKAEDKRRGIEAGADAYIVKGDFNQNSLIDTLRSLLG